MTTATFEHFRRAFFEDPDLGFTLDVSRIRFPDGFREAMTPRFAEAFRELKRLEAGEIANPDEGRMVGHYWLRAPKLAPSATLEEAIATTIERVKRFSHLMHEGRFTNTAGAKFEELLVVGIGGSALGPQFVASALGTPRDPMRIHFLDNTDPDGIDRVLDGLADKLDRTLVLVISKSGGTKETRNGMLEVKARYEARGLSFGRHAVAITGDNSELHRFAIAESFVDVFPMWDWVGGRTSVTSAVGLLPAALQGLDVDSLLEGARLMDVRTRIPDEHQNPAAILAGAWHAAASGHGRKDMVILPYKDGLELFSRYLQQLVMESLGKRLDRYGNEVFQGLSVFGNKGSTDQHAYVQQLRDGLDNFFVTFLEVLQERDPRRRAIEVEPGVTTGDYLAGFLRGTREALTESGRESITIGVTRLDARAVGMLIALYERAVSLYASLVHVNAYHQPGVEAGKKAATAVLALQARVLGALRSRPGAALALEEVASAVGEVDPEPVFHVLRRLAANPAKHVVETRPSGASVFEARWCLQTP